MASIRANLSADIPSLAGKASVSGGDDLIDFVWELAATVKIVRRKINKYFIVLNILEPKNNYQNL
jgi:hypothetical protein